MYHSVNFYSDDNPKIMRNSWDDWHLVPSSRPVFNPPTLKAELVEIPGVNGTIDLSKALTGYPTYNNRQGSIEFIVVNGYSEWHELYSEIMNFIHGRIMKVSLEDDPDYYYRGLFTINNWLSNNDGTWSNITIDYNLSPYKYHDYFETVISLSGNGNGSISTDLSNKIGNAPTNPKFIVSDSVDGIDVCVTNMFNSEERRIEVYDGETTVIKNITLIPGGCSITISGSGSISMSVKKGSL